MNARVRLPAVLLATALLFSAAAPAIACSLMAITPDYIHRSADRGEAVWIGRVTAVTPEVRPETAFGGPDGKATIVFDRHVRGAAGAELVVPYNTRPFCGYPWSPRVGDRLLVIQYPTGPHLFTEAQVAGSRYARYFKAPH